MRRELSPLLAQVPSFSGLRDDDLRALVGACQEVHLREGELVFREGDADQRVVFVLRGEVEVFR